MIGPPEDHLDDLSADPRHAAGDRGEDPEPPVRVLVEAQHLARERHAERTRTSSTTPTIQVSSRGYLKAPKRKTWTMWTSTRATMKFEPQPCIARRNQPSGCS